MKKQKKKEITKDRVIIVGLVCFIMGYAANGIIGSITDLPNKQSSAGIETVEKQSPENQVNISQEDILREKVNTNPHDTLPWINLGNYYFDTNRYDEAIETYLQALELEPDNPDVLSDLGVMYRRAGKPENAISSFDKVQQIDPTHTMSLFNKGIVQFYDLNLKNEAVETWKKLASIDPDFKMPTGELISDFIGSIE